jgi:hypothetical protein
MKKNITYKWGIDNLLIELGNMAEPRMRILYSGELLFTAGTATVLLFHSFRFTNAWLSWGFTILAASLYALAIYRFLVRMYGTEQIVLNEESITLIRKTPFTMQIRSFPWSGLSPLYYHRKSEKTAHPLKGSTFDYWGLDAHENFVQRLHHDGNLHFRYNGQAVYFARGVYSWHAEEMVYMMKLYAGKQLRLGPEWQQLLKSQQVDDEQ